MAAMELDQLDRIAAEAFEGYIVRKDLVRTFARHYPVPTYVCEFLLGRYCASIDEREIAEGLAIVERQLRERDVRSGEEELFKSRTREKGVVKLIDAPRVSSTLNRTSTPGRPNSSGIVTPVNTSSLCSCGPLTRLKVGNRWVSRPCWRCAVP